MDRSDSEAAQLDADLQFPLHVQDVFPELRFEYPEIIGGHEAYVLLGVRDGHPALKFYFDEQSHLRDSLLRIAVKAQHLADRLRQLPGCGRRAGSLSRCSYAAQEQLDDPI